MKAEYFFLSILCLLLPHHAFPQSGDYAAGGRSLALSDAHTVLADGYAFFHNPAALSHLESFQLLGSYQLRSQWEGMHIASAAAVGKYRGLGWGIGAWRFGDEVYSEQWLGVAAGYQMGIASLGARLIWLQYHIEGFGRRHLPLLELGGYAQLTEQLAVGGHVSNVLLAKLSKETGERLPTVMKLGVGYTPIASIQLLAEVHQPTRGATQLMVAVEYEIIPKLWLRTGSQVTHGSYSGGMGYQWRRWRVDYAVATHQPAGWSHSLSINYQWLADEVLTF